jgi:hypothetical protein
MPAHLADPEHNPSFTRGLFLGELREDLVFPFPELAPADKESLTAVLDSFRAWAAATVDTARLDREGRFGDEVRAGMAELGMMGLNIPEEYGGFGASALLFSRVFGEVGTIDASLAVYFGAHSPSDARESRSSAPTTRSGAGSRAAPPVNSSRRSASPNPARAPTRRRCAPPPLPPPTAPTTC